MAFSRNNHDSAPAASPRFNTTHWSVVLAAGETAVPGGAAALEQLCRAYWYPLYAFVRRQGHDSHEAQDLTQEFLSRLLEGNALGSAHPDKGRFRSFLIASLNHFLANEWKHSQRQKRGGSHTQFSLDEETAEDRFRHEPADTFTPEKAFERRWAETLLQGVLDRLRDEWEGKAAGAATCRFDDVKPFLLDGKEAAPFADAARHLGITEASLKWAVHKLRKRYAELFREEIAHTVSSADEMDDEIRHLFLVMSG